MGKRKKKSSTTPNSSRFGWDGPEAARKAWDVIGDRFETFRVFGEAEPLGRRCAWDSWENLGWDINRSHLCKQEIGDCVSFGAAIAIAAVSADEIVRAGEPELFKVPFAPYIYGVSRVKRDLGNGRLGRGDGSLGSWAFDGVKKYGVLFEDDEGVPGYSGRLAKQWGASDRGFRQFEPTAADNLIKSGARIRTVDDLAAAINNGYYCTIASMQGYSMRLRADHGKSWFTGRDTWPHQMSFIAVDTDPELCFYRRNQWGTAHGRQLDGPDGGGWVRADRALERELADSGTECFAHSQFEGFPAESEKPRNWFA